MDFHKRLSADYTLFNLNDSVTTKYYIKNIDYIITNFPYFADIGLVTEYLTSGNPRFSSKFVSKMPKFLKIVKYECPSEMESKGLTVYDLKDVLKPIIQDLKNDSKQIENNEKESLEMENNKAGALQIENNQKESLEMENNEKDSLQVEKNVKDSLQVEKNKTAALQIENNEADTLQIKPNKQESINNNSQSINDSKTLPNSKMLFLNNPGESSETINSTETIDQTDIFIISQEDKSTKFVKKIEACPGFPNQFPKGPGLTVNSTQTVMKYFARVISYFLGSFTIDLDFLLCLLDKVEFGEIEDLFLKLAIEGNMLSLLVSHNCVLRIISKSIKILSLMIDEILYTYKHSLPDECTFIDQIYEYKSLLVERFFTIGLIMGYIDNCDEIRNIYIGENSSYNKETQSSTILSLESEDISPDTSDESSNNKLSEYVLNEDFYKLKEKFLKNSAGFSMEFSYIYNILHMLCKRKEGLEIKYISCKNSNRFILYYLRLASYNKIAAPPIEFLNQVVDLFFAHPNSSHLLTSCMRLFSRTSLSVLKSIGFFDRTKTYMTKYAADFLSLKVPDSLFSFLIRIYARFAEYLLSEFPDWEDFHQLMEHFYRIERIRYKPEDIECAEDPEVFDRFIIQKLVEKVPHKMIFRSDEN